ncbi:DUF1102 domain-containing protein [Halorubrum sp. N11]|uniref:DUF1102 domain-containing protein n=1 Tax=Halorubrum sp. N11 TaxID=3402276 RepID=UPI003EB83B8F
MQRRKFVVGLGALASGSAAAVGTGAFTSVEADRSVDVEVAGDSSAYLALRKAAGPNSDPGANSDAYVDDSGAEVSFDFSSSNNTTDLGDGFNPNAVTEIDDLIEVQNQGTQSAYLSVDTANLDLSDGSGNQAGVGLAVRADESATSNLNDNIAFDSTGSNPDGGSIADPTADGAYELTQGESVHLDLTVDTTVFDNANVSTSGSITFIADQSSSL